MSTHSSIRIHRADGSVTGVYCHSDGYLSYVGVMLQRFYSTPEKVEALLALGDLSSLGMKIPKAREEVVNSELGYEGQICDGSVCVPYTLWRGEQFCQSLQDDEYIYTFHESVMAWTVRQEKKISSGTLSDHIYGYSEDRFLIDELTRLSEKEWDNWKEENVNLESCVKAAKEARAELERKRADEADAYYRAYCD